MQNLETIPKNLKKQTYTRDVQWAVTTYKNSHSIAI